MTAIPKRPPEVTFLFRLETDPAIGVPSAVRPVILIQGQVGKPRRLDQEIVEQTRLDWGHQGARPRTTAFDILAYLFGREIAEQHHLPFYQQIISALEREDQLPASEIHDWLTKRMAVPCSR